MRTRRARAPTQVDEGMGDQPSCGCFVPEEEMYGGPDDVAREGGQLSIDEVEEGVEEGKVVKSFEVRSDQVRPHLARNRRGGAWRGVLGRGPPHMRAARLHHVSSRPFHAAHACSWLAPGSVAEVLATCGQGGVASRACAGPVQVEAVKRRCLPGAGGLNYPMLEEYDFRGDRNTPDLNVRGGAGEGAGGVKGVSGGEGAVRGATATRPTST